MKSLAEHKNNLVTLLKALLNLKAELKESYSRLKDNFNPLANTLFFDKKRAALNEIIEKIRYSGATSQDNPLKTAGESESESEEEEIIILKDSIKKELLEIAELNAAFSGLIKKNMYYNQLTISFIADSFKRNSIYGKGGQNDSGFFPLKNVLIKSGVRA
jgi:hypothetical protein